MDGAVGVVAIRIIGYITDRLGAGHRGNGRVAVCVAVGVLVPGHATFVHAAVAIVVDTVFADFRGPGINRGIGIITVRVVGDVAGHQFIRPDGRVAVAVAVGILIVVGGHDPAGNEQAQHQQSGQPQNRFYKT